MSWQYKVYYDYEKLDSVWSYNNIYEISLNDKHLHEAAEAHAVENIEENIEYLDYRIIKVTCD